MERRKDWVLFLEYDMNVSVDEILNTAKGTYKKAEEALKSLNDRISDDFFRAVESISASDKVFVSGIGKSGLIGRKISATFSSIGLASYFLHPVEALHGDIGMVGEGDVVILLSKSGSTDEIVKLIPYLKSRSAKIISIVGNIKSYLAEYSDITLDGSVESEACPFNIAPTTSTLVALAIGDALAVSVMKYKKMKIEDFSRNHPLGQIGRNLSLNVKDLMHSNHSLPLIASKSSFRNAIIEITNKGLGCVCVIDTDNILKGIITDGDVRRVLQKLDDIRGLYVEDVMTRSPITVKSNDVLVDALALMENRSSQISILPVVDEIGRCIGVIRLHDIVRSAI